MSLPPGCELIFKPLRAITRTGSGYFERPLMNLINTPVRTAVVEDLWKFEASAKTLSLMKQKCRKQQRARERAHMHRVVLPAYFAEQAEEQRERRSIAILEASEAKQRTRAHKTSDPEQNRRHKSGHHFDGRLLAQAANDCFSPDIGSTRIEKVIYIGNPAMSGNAEKLVIASCAKNRAYA